MYKRTETVPIKITGFVERPQVVLVNCLDWCYGDSLHKLFNVQYYLDHCPQLGCCVLIPKEIRHFVPDGVAEILEVDLPTNRYQYWHVSLEEPIRELVNQKEKVYSATGAGGSLR